MDEFRGLLERHVRPDGATAIDGVRICRSDQHGGPRTSMSGTVLAVIATGGKRLALGERVFDYRVGQYLVASVDLPVTGHLLDDEPGRSSLGFGMTLEPAEIAELLLTGGPVTAPPPAGPGIAVSDAPAELMDAIVRLLRLLDRPQDRIALAPLVKREILWRLLTGEQGDAVRQLGLADSRLSHVRRAVRWIRENYPHPVRVDDLARLAGMSVSAFHRNFQDVTAMTPLRFQKQIRLQEARLLLARGSKDITTVAYEVGYRNLSQFSREYRRQFGVPPSLDSLQRHEDELPELVRASGFPGRARRS
ncbi:AraC family transcriptional regulator [Amycolatopsis sp. NPDC048633]|uniref:AraC family transcriptional regulator n=1 Tax=Amycolatopsis sp. NPDC048633 TaxID=3157095 RepID=UPI0033C4B614